MKMLSQIILLIIPVCFYSCQPASTQEQDVEQTIFENVNVIPMTSEAVIEGQSVIVRDGKIHRIAAANEVNKGSKSTVINGAGKYLVPGIAEMHAHIPNPESSLDVNDVLFLYLSNGITTIRGMLGHPSHLQLREDVLNDKVLGPTIWTSSPSMNGNSVPTEEMADSLVRAHKRAGYDFFENSSGH